MKKKNKKVQSESAGDVSSQEATRSMKANLANKSQKNCKTAMPLD